MTFEPSAKTNWGSFGPWKYCPSGRYVNAMQIKVEGKQGGGDDTAMNAIRLYCNDGSVLISSEMPWGGWWTKITSSNRIYGVRLRSEPGQGGGDDTAANGIRFKDRNGKEYTPGDGYWGDWSAYSFCRSGTVVTGFRTQVEGGQGGGDDTALNRVQFYCSFVP